MSNNSNKETTIGQYAWQLYEELREVSIEIERAFTLRGKPALPPMIVSLANLIIIERRFEMIARAKGLTLDAARLIHAHRHMSCGLTGPCKESVGDELTRLCNMAGEVIEMYGLTEELP